MNEKFYFHGKLHELAEGIYFPSEDSYLLAQNVLQPGKFCMDMGCGSGIQSLNLLYKGAEKVLAVDINPKALEITKKNCTDAGFGKKIQTRQSNLFENVQEKADVIVFNPPYVESEKLQEIDLDGGKLGREVLDRFIEQMPNHLNPNGQCYFLQTDINGYEQTKKKLTTAGLGFEIIARKKGFFEELAIIRTSRQ